MLKRICAIALLSFALATPALARTSDDPDYDRQWYLETIGAPAAWDITTGSRDVTVAVLDSGVDLDHLDLAANIWTNPNEIAGNGVDDDGNGYVDDNRGWDFVGDDNVAAPDPEGGYSVDGVAHGTVIAGLISAVGNNGEGVAGVSWKTKIMPLRILDSVGSGESSDARLAIEYAIANGADAINLSFTGYEVDPAFEETVRQAYLAGIPVIAAVGNQNGGGMDLDETPLYPACFSGVKADWVIGVAATTRKDTKADFSNYGSDCTEISAPGTDMYGTMFQDDAWDDFTEYYAEGWSGTSVAAPLVTGAIALLKSAYPSLTPTLLRTVLQLSVDPVRERGTASAGQMGAGRLNVGRAMEIAPAFASAAVTEAEPAETGISPITGLEEEITAVSSGSFIRSPGFDTVYYIGSDATRHPLWDEKTFFTWNDSWDDVTWVTDATLSTYALGAVLPPKPGVVLVKVQSANEVYAVESAGEPWEAALRVIASEDIASSLYGAAWADYVIDIEPTLFSHYEDGEPMTGNEDVDRDAMKTRESL